MKTIKAGRHLDVALKNLHKVNETLGETTITPQLHTAIYMVDQCIAAISKVEPLQVRRKQSLVVAKAPNEN